MSIRRIVIDRYIDTGRRTIPVQLVKRLISEIEDLQEHDSDVLGIILILTAEIESLRKEIKNMIQKYDIPVSSDSVLKKIEMTIPD